jgi:malonyl-CoA O-methyltransferase
MADPRCATTPLPETPAETFPIQVRRCFARRASRYDQLAHLQRSVAWRLGRLCRDLPLPQGPHADLGAGSGLLARALEAQGQNLALLRLDNCAELLQQEERAPWERATEKASSSLLWDLNRGLPAQLNGAALLASSFSLQWLERPMEQLELWCRCLRPGGWLALALPTQGSFPEWHRAARSAGVPCTALPLPTSSELRAVAQSHLRLRHDQLLRFRRRRSSALGFLREFKGLGAGASPFGRLRPADLHALENHWQAEGGLKSLGWEVQILVGQRPMEENP